MFRHPRRVNSVEDIKTPPITEKTIENARSYINRNTNSPQIYLDMLGLVDYEDLIS